jgi:hypothetical protein
LAKLLDQVLAGEDIRPQTTDELAARITPDASKWVQHRLSTLWPGGTLILVKRTPSPDGAGQSTSVFRIRKGTDAVLIFFGLDSKGKVSTLRTAPDRDYE